MLNLKKIAVTGGLSCGKSSVCRVLKELGAYVVIADEIIHKLLSSDISVAQEVVKLLGTEVLSDHQIIKSRVAQIVFSNPVLLEALENLLHPATYREIDKEYQKQSNLNHPPPLFVAEIPLLFESGGDKIFHHTVAVVADDDLCVQRFYQATGYDKQEFDKRMARQLPSMEKAKRADYIIVNNGTPSDLYKEVTNLYQKLKATAG